MSSKLLRAMLNNASAALTRASSMGSLSKTLRSASRIPPLQCFAMIAVLAYVHANVNSVAEAYRLVKGETSDNKVMRESRR